MMNVKNERVKKVAKEGREELSYINE